MTWRRSAEKDKHQDKFLHRLMSESRVCETQDHKLAYSVVAMNGLGPQGLIFECEEGLHRCQRGRPSI
jgi:hypothetical protein